VHCDVGDDAALGLPSEHQSHCHSVTTIDTHRYIYPRIWTRIDNRSSSLFPHQQHTQHSPKVRLRVPCGSLEYTTTPAQQFSVQLSLSGHPRCRTVCLKCKCWSVIKLYLSCQRFDLVPLPQKAEISILKVKLEALGAKNSELDGKLKEIEDEAKKSDNVCLPSNIFHSMLVVPPSLECLRETNVEL